MKDDSFLWRARYRRSGSPVWKNIDLGLELLDLEDVSYCRHVALIDLMRREESGELIDRYELAFTVTTLHDRDFQRWALFWERIDEVRRIIGRGI